MAFHNANYGIVEFASGVNPPHVCGVGASGATVHEVFCAEGGEVEITAIGGGTVTVTLAAGQSVKVLCSTVTVNSGTFVGFKSFNQGVGNRLLG